MRHRFASLLLLACINPAPAQQYVINTVAGGAPPRTPVAAFGSSFPSPGGLTVDSTGTLYAVSQNCVFTISPGGIMNRIAGIARAGFAGDGGPALNAQFNVPLGLALDAAKNLYIADSVNNRIRKISAVDGSVSTVAGNGTAGFAGDAASALTAELNNPTAVVIDTAGNLYIADTGNNRVRKVAANGTITTVAGNGTAEYKGDNGPAISASLNGPKGLAIDSTGVLYIADTGNLVIRKVIPYGGGQISTVAGNGARGGAFIKPNSIATGVGLGNVESLALDASGNLFIVDTSNHQIWKLSGNLIGPAWNVTVGPSFIGGWFDSTGIAVDAGGNVYLNRPDYVPLLFRVAPDGTATEIAGYAGNFGGDHGPATLAQLSSPGGVALDPDGNLYIADTGNSVLRKVTTDGIIDTIPALAGYLGSPPGTFLYHPSSLAFDSVGNLFVANDVSAQDNHYLLELTPKGKVNPITPEPGYLIYGMVFDSFGTLFVSTFDAVLRFSGGIWSNVAGNGTYPLNTSTVWVSKDGAGAASTPLYQPSQIALDTSGAIYIADRNDQRIRKVSAGLITSVAGTATTQGVGIQGFTGDGGPATSAQLNNPMGVALDRAGNIFIADTGNHRIRRISSDGTIATIAGNGTPAYSGDGGLATAAALNGPSSLFLDKSGNIYVCDTANNAIRVISLMQSLAFASATLPGATVGLAYSAPLTATGGALPYTWTVTAGTLPPGLTLSGSGSIAGSPTAPGTYSFTITVNDPAKNTASQPFRMVVIAPLAIAPVTLPQAIIGTTYSQALAASGGTPPYSWSIINGALPAGLSLSTAGLLSGTPAAAGISKFTAQVTDANSSTATQSFSIQTLNPPPVLSTAATLPTAVTGMSYSDTLIATGGNPPYVWSGTLPSGLQLSPLGVITGVPTVPGEFNVILTITDSAALTATQTFQLTILDSATLSRTAVMPQVQATAITLTNPSAEPTGVVLIQHSDDGTVAAGNAPAALLAPNAAVTLPISDPAVTWVDVLSSDPLTTSTAVPPITQFAPEFEAAYDNTAGPASDAVILINLSPTAITLTATVLDPAGNQLDLQQLQLPATGRLSFPLVTRFPATSSLQGVVKFQNPEGGNLAGCTLSGP